MKMDDWNTGSSLLFGWLSFRGELLVVGSVNIQLLSLITLNANLKEIFCTFSVADRETLL